MDERYGKGNGSKKSIRCCPTYMNALEHDIN